MAHPAVHQHPQIPEPIPRSKEENFCDAHFAKIAFAVSTVALLILAPLNLFLGAAVGAGLHYYFEPQLRLKPDDKIVTLPNTIFAIVGAMAALVGLTPAGAMGGFLFQAIPFLTSLAVGSTGYRAAASYRA